jgi:hypothetical protein
VQPKKEEDEDKPISVLWKKIVTLTWNKYLNELV